MKNKGLLHSGVTNVTQEEPLRTYMDKRGATYYFRRVVPEPLRPYLLTESGKPRIEFMISLRTKDRREANDRLERESIRVSALINEAQRRFDAGIPHTAKAKSGNDPRQDAREAYEREAEQYVAAQIAHDEAELIEVIDSLRRPPAELSTRDKYIRSLLPPELLASDEEMAAKEREALAVWEEGALEANEAFERTGGVATAMSAQAGSAPAYPRLMDIFDRYVVVRQLAPATVKSWRKPIQHLIE